MASVDHLESGFHLPEWVRDSHLCLVLLVHHDFIKIDNFLSKVVSICLNELEIQSQWFRWTIWTTPWLFSFEHFSTCFQTPILKHLYQNWQFFAKSGFHLPEWVRDSKSFMTSVNHLDEVPLCSNIVHTIWVGFYCLIQVFLLSFIFSIDQNIAVFSNDFFQLFSLMSSLSSNKMVVA
jgi:hypothetical protein